MYAPDRGWRWRKRRGGGEKRGINWEKRGRIEGIFD